MKARAILTTGLLLALLAACGRSTQNGGDPSQPGGGSDGSGSGGSPMGNPGVEPACGDTPQPGPSPMRWTTGQSAGSSNSIDSMRMLRAAMARSASEILGKHHWETE